MINENAYFESLRTIIYAYFISNQCKQNILMTKKDTFKYEKNMEQLGMIKIHLIKDIQITNKEESSVIIK